MDTPTQGVKYDGEKPKWSLIPKGVLAQVVEVLTYGSKKYTPDNWMYVEKSRYYDALLRHVDAFHNGEKLDPETGKHHLAHALCCLMYMLWHDDNPPQKTPNEYPTEPQPGLPPISAITGYSTGSLHTGRGDSTGRIRTSSHCVQ